MRLATRRRSPIARLVASRASTSRAGSRPPSPHHQHEEPPPLQVLQQQPQPHPTQQHGQTLPTIPASPYGVSLWPPQGESHNTPIHRPTGIWPGAGVAATPAFVPPAPEGIAMMRPLPSVAATIANAAAAASTRAASSGAHPARHLSPFSRHGQCHSSASNCASCSVT